MTCAISASVVGQMSGQLLKPKKTSVHLPRKSSSVRTTPSWPVNSNSATTEDAALVTTSGARDPVTASAPAPSAVRATAAHNPF